MAVHTITNWFNCAIELLVLSLATNISVRNYAIRRRFTLFLQRTPNCAIVTVEAMKMEIPVVAPEDGTVASIDVAVGDAVESGAVLATLN